METFRSNPSLGLAPLRFASGVIKTGENGAYQALMKTAMHQLKLTARACHRVLKLSRTIADLVESEAITHAHLAEALQYRPKLDLM